MSWLIYTQQGNQRNGKKVLNSKALSQKLRNNFPRKRARSIKLLYVLKIGNKNMKLNSIETRRLSLVSLVIVCALNVFSYFGLYQTAANVFAQS